MILNIFEYVFCRSYLQYQKWGEKEIPGVYAISVVLILQEINIFSLFLFGILLRRMPLSGAVGYYLALFFLVLFLFDYIYIYKVKGVAQIMDRFANNKTGGQRIKIFSILYVVLSIVLFVGLMAQRIYF